MHNIGDSAFENTAISYINLRTDTLSTIGERAFYNTYLSGDIAITNNIISIGENAFGRCTDIESFSFANSSNLNDNTRLNSNVIGSYYTDSYGALFEISTLGGSYYITLLQFPAAGSHNGSGENFIYDMSNMTIDGTEVALVINEISPEAFYGLLCGMLSANFDITLVVVDGFLKIIDADIKPADLGCFFEKTDKLLNEHNVRMVIGISGDPAEMPEFITRYAI